MMKIFARQDLRRDGDQLPGAIVEEFLLRFVCETEPDLGSPETAAEWKEREGFAEKRAEASGVARTLFPGTGSSNALIRSASQRSALLRRANELLPTGRTSELLQEDYDGR